jgi:hypothetical protein
MFSGKYTFTRNDGRSGFLRTNTVNTDARNALADWANASNNRSFDILQGDDDDELRALLSFQEQDHEARPDLDRECNTHGVQRRTVEAV